MKNNFLALIIITEIYKTIICVKIVLQAAKIVILKIIVKFVKKIKFYNL